MRRKVAIGAVVILLLIPALVFGAYKPSRVLIADLVPGIACIPSSVCIDNKGRLPQARMLYSEALHFVETNVGAIESYPRIIFCSTPGCFAKFGFHAASAHTVGVSGIVVGPRGWKPHILRHELIHHLQAERFGLIGYFRKPEWLIEGMAYALSEDPRDNLGQPFQGYRDQFLNWYAGLDSGAVFNEASDLNW